MDFNKIGTFNDKIINSDYDLVTCDAGDLSEYLKTLYGELDIDINEHNGSLKSNTGYSWDKKADKKVSEKPPEEIYEYQNFFLLESEGGSYILLDGFRRLLWYTAPNTPIFVRIYKQSDLSNKDILLLLVYLNHFKFFGGGQYLERGFSLLLKSVFDVDIFKYKTTFDSYLSRNSTVNTYSGIDKPMSTEYNDVVKSRILNDFFVSDIRFIQDIFNSGFMCNSYFGSLTYKFRKDFDKDFDSRVFINHLKNSPVIADLMVKYDKVGTRNSSESQKVVNQILEIYTQAFNVMVGVKVEKSYAEKIKECKDLVAKYKKDKSLIKITGNINAHNIKAELRKRIVINKEKVNFICVVFPNEIDTYNNNRDQLKPIEHGVVDIDVQHLKTSTHLMVTSYFYGFKLNDSIYTIRDNYGGGYYSTGKSFTYIDSNHRNRQDIQLFAELPKSILKK